ncbi:MAG: delta-60 repeat domain-containing protein [Ignavibacteria bacterium]|nr:delta-60 repeat domain-containing protein [Ignavibacteria bacterium]
MKYIYFLLSFAFVSVSVSLAQVPNPAFIDLPNDEVTAVAVDPTYVYIGGSLRNVAQTTRRRLARYNRATGLLDPIWNPNVANGTVNCISVSGSDVFIGGSFILVNDSNFRSNTHHRNFIAKISSIGAGTLDSLWNPSADAQVFCIAVNGMDIYVGGAFTNIGGATRNGVAKLSAIGVGTADTSWNPNANSPTMFTRLLWMAQMSM